MEKKNHKIYLKLKWKKKHGIPVITPQWGESYELVENVQMVGKIERREEPSLRREVMDRLEKLKEEIQDMEVYVKEDVNDANLSDRDIFSINERIKVLEKQILNIIEG